MLVAAESWEADSWPRVASKSHGAAEPIAFHQLHARPRHRPNQRGQTPERAAGHAGPGHGRPHVGHTAACAPRTPQVALPAEQEPRSACGNLEADRLGWQIQALPSLRGGGGMQTQIPHGVLLCVSPMEPLAPLYTRACAWTALGWALAMLGRARRGRAEGPGLAHQPQASFLPGLGLGL